MLRGRRRVTGLIAGLIAIAAVPAAAALPKPPARSFERSLAVVSGRVARLDTGEHFNLVGLRWRGARDAHVELRARAGGHWSSWVAVGHSDGIGRGGRTVSDPVWAGDADALELRANRSLPGLVADFQNTTGTATAHDRAVTALRHGVSAVVRPLAAVFRSSDADAAPSAPQILPRSSWNDGSCRPRARPLYGSVRMAFVHHTVTLNDYSPQDSASIVLAICRYHVQQNGWNDIGYNFLVDKYGQVFEGRAGGVDQAVVGAQAQGWNSQSTGVSVLGTYTSTALDDAGLNALSQLLAWKLSLHGVAPIGSVALTSPGGSENRWPAGTRVEFNTISGHRDGDSTSCPGDALYAQLPEIRRRAAGASSSTRRPSLGADRPSVAYRGTVRLRGFTQSPPGSWVRIEARTRGSWHHLADTTTDASGGFEHVMTATRTRRYRAVGPLGSSRAVRVQVHARVATLLRGAARVSRGRYSARPGDRLRVYARVVPMKRRLVVRAERLGSGRRWHTARRVPVRTRRGRAWVTLSLTRPGTYRVRVLSFGDSRNAAGRSHPIPLEVAR